MNNEELIPCKCNQCGSEETYYNVFQSGSNVSGFQVYCENCYTHGPRESSQKIALESWEKMNSLKARLEALERAILQTSAKPCLICKDTGNCGKDKGFAYLDHSDCFEFDEDRFKQNTQYTTKDNTKNSVDL